MQTLKLKSWSFNKPDQDPPHRQYEVARCQIKRGVSVGEVWVVRNHGSFKPTWYLGASGVGFAGDRSRWTNSRRTQSEKVAREWIAVVKSGQVEFED